MIQYKYIKDQHVLNDLIPRLLEYKAWGLDLETSGLDPHQHKILLCQIGRPDENYVIDTRYCDLRVLKDCFFENRDMVKIAHQGKFEYKFIRALGIYCEKIRCTFLAEKVLNAGKKNYLEDSKLDEVVLRKLKREMGFDKKAMQLSFVGHVGDFTDKQLQYAASDTDVLLPLLQYQWKQLVEVNLLNTFILESEALPVFSDIEFDGIPLSGKLWSENIAKNKLTLSQLGAELDLIRDNSMFQTDPVNYGSSDQVLKIIRKMGLKSPSYSKEKQCEVMKLVTSTGKDTLAYLAKYPFVNKLLQWRSMSTRISNFGEGYLKSIHPVTGMIHPEIFQIGASNGRITKSPDGPNFLNIPREGGFRECVIAPDGYVMENDDYVTGEPRIVANNSGCRKMIDIFNRGEDFYLGASREMHGTVCNLIDRPLYKKLALSIHYGEGVVGFYEDLRINGSTIDMKEASASYYKYKQTFREVIDYLESNGRLACEQLYLANGNGRRRYWDNPLTDAHKAAVRREGGNYMISSVNADFIKVALTNIRRYIIDNKVRSRVVNSVYDDILTCTHEHDSQTFHAAKQKIMQDAAEMFIKKVRMPISGAVLKHWSK